MFDHAESFNQDISNWDVDNVNDWEDVFNGADLMEEENKPNFNWDNADDEDDY